MLDNTYNADVFSYMVHAFQNYMYILLQTCYSSILKAEKIKAKTHPRKPYTVYLQKIYSMSMNETVL